MVTVADAQLNVVYARHKTQDEIGIKVIVSSFIFSCFILGLVNNIELLKTLKREAINYNDILLFDFWESYWNLSIKSVTAINWAVNNSPVNILMKIDDDILCNVSRMYGEMMKRIDSQTQGHHKVVDPESSR